MPNVVTDDPATPIASRKLTPLFHQMINEKPNRMRHSHIPNSATVAPGPTNERTRSRNS